MSLKLCQGSKCHTYHTKDRLKGTKGSKTYQTEEEVLFIMAMETFVLLIVRTIGSMISEIVQ